MAKNLSQLLWSVALLYSLYGCGTIDNGLIASIASSSTSKIYFGPPGSTGALVSTSPANGAIGTLLTFSGMDFTSTQSVTVAGTAVIPISSSTSSYVGFVMPGTVTGPIVITGSTGGTLTSYSNFAVTATGVPVNQQGSKVVGTGNVGTPSQGASTSISADGNTMLSGGFTDNGAAGAAWVFTRSAGVWSQQAKLVGTGVANSNFGNSVALSADGNTALIGAATYNSNAGAAFVFTRSAGVWTQQGSTLVGTGAIGAASQGYSVALSADGNTAVVGGRNDNSSVGAAWIFTRSARVWTQQGSKLVGTGAIGAANQGFSVALSADGNTAAIGGNCENSMIGATWVFTRSGGVWTQQGSKLTMPRDELFSGRFGASVALNADGNTLVGGAPWDNSSIGAVFVYTRSAGVWSQQGLKLVGTGNNGASTQGTVSITADGNVVVSGGRGDNAFFGAVWVFTRSAGVWKQNGSKLVGTGVVGTPNLDRPAISADGSTFVVGGTTDNSNLGATWIFTP